MACQEKFLSHQFIAITLSSTVLFFLFTDVKEPSDIAVDWVSNHIYWVDTKAKTIEVADYDGLSRRILVSTNLRGPRNIAADPISG